MEIPELFNLRGKTALVTGCRRGIGRSMAVALAEAGADIVGVSASLAPDSDVGREIQALGRIFTGYPCNFEHRQDLYAIISRIEQECPPIDILVNNAGMIERGPVADHEDERWERVLEVNLTAGFVLAREIGKKMLSRGAGKIIFTASLLSFQGGILVPSYSASKGALAQLCKAMSNEWAGHGVQVNAIAPGYIETDVTAPLLADPRRNRAILERIPAGRWGKPDDLKGAVVFLASAASDYVTGHILTVDGGWMAR